MNSWDGGVPSERVFKLEQAAREAMARFREAKTGYAEATSSTRAFWKNVMADRRAALQAVEASLREERESSPSTPDMLDGDTSHLDRRGQ